MLKDTTTTPAGSTRMGSGPSRSSDVVVNDDALYGDPAVAAVVEEAELLHASVKIGLFAQIIVALAAMIGLIYLLKPVLITILAAALLAFVLDPLVNGFSRIKAPRPVGAFIAVLLTLGIVGVLTGFFYTRAMDFATELPKYSHDIRQSLARVREQTGKIEESTRSLMASPKTGKPTIAVEIQEAPGLSRAVAAGSGTAGEVLLCISFLPFLVYFMLTWKNHVHTATVQLFPRKHRLLAHRTVGRISGMVRSFILGNVLVGLVNSAAITIVFWHVGIPYFYFVGVISGFLSLIPYLGLFLSILPPLAGGMGVLTKGGVGLVLASVIVLHILTANALYPKIVGWRLRLNPLAVTLSLLFWAWVWGAMGLIFAIPILGATKIVCDYVDSLHGVGAWLGDQVA